jgi:hypothetical protein
MHPRMTSIQAQAHDAGSHTRAAAGALAFVNDSSGAAAPPAPDNAVAALKGAWPFAPRLHTLGGHTGHVYRKTRVRPSLAAMGPPRTPLSAYTPSATPNGSA